MAPVFAQMMDGQSYEVEISLSERVSALRQLLAEASGISVLEVQLLCDTVPAEDSQILCDILDADAPEVVLVRVRTASTKALMWYDRYLASIAETEADDDFRDVDARIRLGASLYALGEYAASWTEYKTAVSIMRGGKHGPLTDEILLEDPVVGKYMRVLNRAWHKHKYKFDAARALKLLSMLVQAGRGQELVTAKWETYLPYNYHAVSTWLLSNCRITTPRCMRHLPSTSSA
eukprot:TRINITY_DN25504_c0_g1_i1.p1 TRINITY_DN25504_c0_g1~~TRINITY_DN25504_c0_g1_i1.p1  ORF type:complete len:254 (+),score=46.59 TRINITY_DN25504_c0_g1_i1:66-764(+)